MEGIVVKPRIAPRDVVDAAIGISVGVLLSVVLFGIPAVVTFWLTGHATFAFCCAAGAYVVYLLFSVSRLVVTPAGIRLSRLAGAPRLVPWESITDVREAARSELILRGWLWPLFPSREMTLSLTSVGHVRVEFGTGCFYFPPRDTKSFIAIVRAKLA